MITPTINRQTTKGDEKVNGKVLSLHLTWCIFSSQLILASMVKRERLLFSARFIRLLWESPSGLVYDVEKLMQI